MGVNQSRHQRRAGQLNDAAFRRNALLLSRPCALDLVAADKHHPAVVRFQGDAIKNARGSEYDRLRGLSDYETGRCQHQGESGQARTMHVTLHCSWQMKSLPLSY